MPNDTTPCNVEQINAAYVEAPKYIYLQISNKIRQAKTLFTNLIKREGFEYGQGYIKYTETFHGGVGVQDGGASWKEMKKYRAPLTDGNTDPGNDPCKSSALVVGFGVEEKSYKIYQTERRTEDICLTDALFTWQLEQTLGLRIKALAEITVAEWEQLLQASYILQTNTKIARFSASDTLGVRLDDLTIVPGDADHPFGGYIAVPAGGMGNVAPLSTTLTQQLYPYLSRQCFYGALGMNEGSPVFGLSASQEAIYDMIHSDAKETDFLKWALPEINIEGYGKMRVYKNFAQHFDWNAPRFTYSSDGKKLVRVYPWKATPTTIDDALNVDPDYIDAPFELVSILVNDVYTAQVPPANPSQIAGGYQFNPQDNLGEFHFKNIEERCDNPYKEKGFFLGRFRMAPKPGDFSNDAISVLVRRCQSALETGCTVCTTANVAATNVDDLDFYDSDGVYTTALKYIATVASCYSGQVGDRVQIVYTSNGGGTAYGIIVNNDDPYNIVVSLDSAYTTRDLTSQTGVTIAATTQARQ